MKITTDKRVQYLFALITTFIFLKELYIRGRFIIQDEELGVYFNPTFECIFYYTIAYPIFLWLTFMWNTEWFYKGITKDFKKPMSHENFNKLWTIIIFIIMVILILSDIFGLFYSAK